ncbi:hypothetical protein BGY98DRAFT_984982 [Russula aff. rugulosa BPL654]|nr:hypothetical protein BGY98DRAFT_984982 [Russula aff. rugulosa BPL654]
MFSFAMDSIFAISLGFALRLVVVSASHYNDRIGGSLVGLWEGAWPMSFDPYVGLGFRLLVDFLFTESIYRLIIVLLWTGLGFILADVTPAFWYDKNLHRFYRRTSRFIRHFDWSSLKLPIPSGAIPRVRFYDLPSRNAPASTTTPPPPATNQRRHSVPGNFPGYSYSSSTDASNVPTTSSALRRPVPASSIPPSALRSVSQPKPSSNSSVSFDLVPHTSEVGNDSFEQLAAEGVPTPKPVPPIIVMPAPVQNVPSGQALSAEPVSSTLVAGNIDLLPEIIEPRDDIDPPPSFDESMAPNKATASVQPREWPSEKLTVRNPDLSDLGSARSSIISGANRDSIIGRAEMLRKQAAAEEKVRDQLHAEHKKAFSERRYPDAVRYKVEQDEANQRALNLHRRAAERYFKAHNLQQDERTIDVHSLKLDEAIRRAEIAIRDALVAGDTRLRVICGLGSRWDRRERELPHLRLALTKALSEQRIESEVDPDNPGVLNIRLPVS